MKFKEGQHRLKNDYEKYAVVDSKGNILEKFRLREAAFNSLPKLKRDYFLYDLKIIVIPRK